MPPADAILIEKSIKTGATKYERLDSTMNFAEPLLGLDRAKGQIGYLRAMPGGSEFITASPLCTINYPTDDPQGRTGPRYNWSQHPSNPNVYLGYLKDKPAEAPTPGTDVVVTPATLEGDGVMKGGA